MSSETPTAHDALRTILQPACHVRGHTTLRELARAMLENGCSAVVVSKVDGTHAVVTERDIIRGLANNLDADGDWAVDVMSVDLRSLGPDASILDAARLMQDDVIRHVVVHTEDGGLTIVSIRDLLAPFIATAED